MSAQRLAWPPAGFALHLPRDIVENVRRARSPCQWFLRGLCRKGRNCAKLHDDPVTGNIDRLPHVSRTWDAILQREVLTLRPPLSLALSSHMRLHNAIMPWTPGSGALRQHRLGNERVVTILLDRMKEPDVEACTAASMVQWATVKNEEGEHVYWIKLRND